MMRTGEANMRRTQDLQELGAAFSGLESSYEASSVAQAHIGTQIQSQLQTLMPDDSGADTPYMARRTLSTASRGFGFDEGAAPITPMRRVRRAATLMPEDLPEVPDSYRGPRLDDLNAPVPLDFATQLVWHFQQRPNEPLPGRYLCKLITDATDIIEEREAKEDGPIWNLEVTDQETPAGKCDPQLVILGDTHGQLNDVLWIFYKMGMPSPVNRYLVNGDICDRGHAAVEIWAMFLAFMCVWPQSVCIQRGNHEDRLMNMDTNCGGFFDEVLTKYGWPDDSAAKVYEKFARLFGRLPLASVVAKRVFVVHGGLWRGSATGGFMKLLKRCKTRSPEIPSSVITASAADMAFSDAMWADPQEGRGVCPNPRGNGLVTFGPDVTAAFLRETGYDMVVRSHQVPLNNDGFFVHHGGKLVTVFSASNYCGVTGNQGAVLVFHIDASCEAVRHYAPPPEEVSKVNIEPPEDMAHPSPTSLVRRQSLARRNTALRVENMAKQTEASETEVPKRQQRLEKEVVQGVGKLVVEHKQNLFAYWEASDSVPPRGFISVPVWKEGMAAELGDIMPWETVERVLRVKDPITNDVDYRQFLSRFRVTIVGAKWGDSWMEEVLSRFYGRLLSLKGGHGSLEELEQFLGGDDGKVSATDAQECLQGVLGDVVTDEQVAALLRTMSAHSVAEPMSPSRRASAAPSVFEFLSMMDVAYQRQRKMREGMAALEEDADSKASQMQSLDKEITPWAKSVLHHLGRLMWMEDSSTESGGDSAKRMLQIFRFFDTDGSGLLERGEFVEAMRKLLSEYSDSLPQQFLEDITDERIYEVMDAVDVGRDGAVNYTEFLHAFQPVDRTLGRGLRSDLMEQLCTTIWSNKPSLLRTFQVMEEQQPSNPNGHISSSDVRRTLRSLNASLSSARGGRAAPLTNDQIDILVDHTQFDEDGTVDYKVFLDAFQIVDMEAAVATKESSRPATQAARPAQQSSNGYPAAPVTKVSRVPAQTPSVRTAWGSQGGSPLHSVGTPKQLSMATPTSRVGSPSAVMGNPTSSAVSKPAAKVISRSAAPPTSPTRVGVQQVQSRRMVTPQNHPGVGRGR